MESILNRVYEALMIAFILFFSQDYFRFRFSPPYVTKKECHECQEACGKLSANKDIHMRDFVSQVDVRLSRMETMLMQFIASPR